MANAIITLTTDYGTNDHLVGTLKGVILKINPDVTIVDITHNAPGGSRAPLPGRRRQLQRRRGVVHDHALFARRDDAPLHRRDRHGRDDAARCPGGDVHGVGTERRPLLVSAGNQYFVAPDNGLLSVVYEREAESLMVRHANAEHYYLQPVSKTFHGRDIFAPIAAWFTKSWQSSGFGDQIEDFKRFALPRPKEADGVVKGVILRADSFGNLITNFRQEDLPEGVAKDGAIQLQVGTQSVTRFVETFAQGNGAEPFAYVGSSGFLEIGVNKGSAARTLGLNRGTAVVLTKEPG